MTDPSILPILPIQLLEQWQARESARLPDIDMRYVPAAEARRGRLRTAYGELLLIIEEALVPYARHRRLLRVEGRGHVPVITRHHPWLGVIEFPLIQLHTPGGTIVVSPREFPDEDTDVLAVDFKLSKFGVSWTFLDGEWEGLTPENVAVSIFRIIEQAAASRETT